MNSYLYQVFTFRWRSADLKCIHVLSYAKARSVVDRNKTTGPLNVSYANTVKTTKTVSVAIQTDITWNNETASLNLKHKTTETDTDTTNKQTGTNDSNFVLPSIPAHNNAKLTPKAANMSIKVSQY